jgi:hypothetical protein
VRCAGVAARCTATLVAVLSSGGLISCQRDSPIVTSIVFDDETRSMSTPYVICARQPNSGLVILVKEKPTRTVRIQLTQFGRLTVQKAGLHYDELSGFVADPQEVTATKVDDTYSFSGRMPPNPGEIQWHTFKIETTCPRYLDAPPPEMQLKPAPSW